MSLIHDALKKAQGHDEAPVGSGTASLKESIEEGRKPPASKRKIVLAAVLVLVLGVFAYMKLYSPTDTEDAPHPKEEGAAAGDLSAGGPADAASMKRRAVDAYRADDLSGAWANISAVVNLTPKDAEAWNNLGLIAKERGDPTKAREAYGKALELKPGYAEALNNMAVMEWQGGNGAGARELLDKALKQLPAYPEANFNMAVIYDKAGDKKKAEDYYRRFLDVGGTFPSNVVEEVRDRVMEFEE